MLHIAEGSAKYSVRDRRNFFIIARASVFECSPIICFLKDEEEISKDLKLNFTPLLMKFPEFYTPWLKA